MNVKLGYEVGTGAEVSVPIAHMIVTGQTQLSGKTTTLEGLVHRATGMRALAFVTKRGEGTFGGSGDRRHLVRPYFRERADWQFVSAILEAETRERMKFERAWIMRATRGAKKLADVRRNITKLQAKSKRSMDQDIYMQLGEYLDAVLPVLDRIDFAPAVELRPGLNIVQLENLPVQVQGLVIASMLTWVHERERDVTTILPESWKFIPQGRNSPVKMSTVSLAREGAGIGNLLWLDSQDIAGAEKEILRSASVWLIGVQREEHEIKRALGQMGHGIKKPRAADIAQLERGQFYACWGAHAVRTYVQPAWMENAEAHRIAESGGSFKLDESTERARRLIGGDGPWRGGLVEAPPVRVEREGDVHATEPFVVRLTNKPQEDEMNAGQEAKLDKLVDAVTMLVERIDRPLFANDGKLVKDDGVGERMAATRAVTRDSDPIGTFDIDKLYEQFRARAMKDPVVLKVLATKPAIDVVVTTQVVEIDGKTLRGRLARMIAESWFDERKTGNAAFDQLGRVGFSTAKPNVYRELDALTEMGFLTKETPGGYEAVKGMKCNVIRK